MARRTLEQLRLMYDLLCNALERENTSENWNAFRLRDEIAKSEQRLGRCPGGGRSLRNVQTDYLTLLKRGKKVKSREFEVECQVSGYFTFYLHTVDPAWTETRLRQALSSGRAKFDMESQRVYLVKGGKRIGTVRVTMDSLDFDAWTVEEQ
jgi:hypothetical protein